jgi:hypothetical protein
MSINPFLFNKTIKDTNIQSTKKEYDKYDGISLTDGSVSGSRSNSSSTTYNNSNLNFKNLKLTSKEDINIKGATIQASNKLDVDVGGNLNVESMQNKNSSSSSSMSASTSGNVNASMSKSSQTTTVLTSLTGANVNIKVAKNLDIVGAKIASVKTVNNKEVDNNNLTINTASLTYRNLSNRKNSRSISLGGSASSTGNQRDSQGQEIEGTSKISNISGNAAFGSQNSKSKTLATLGLGNIKVGNKQLDDKKLNRNISKTKLDLYDVKRDVSASAEVDTRLLTKKGRQEITKEAKQSKVGFYDVAKDIVTKKEVGILDAFSHQGNKVAFFNGMQKAMQSKENRD